MKRDKLVTLQWSHQSSEIMGGYSTPDSMLEIGRLMSTMNYFMMVDIRRPISSIESGVLYPPTISLDCDH